MRCVYIGRPVPSVEDRGEVGSGRLVVEAEAHQRHHLDDLEPVGEAPAIELGVPRRQQEPGASELARRRDQRLEILVGLSDRVREVLAEIKADNDLKVIPVVVLTTSNAEADVLRSYRLHANCYITKPVDFNSFAAAIASLEYFWFAVVTLPPEESGGMSP